MSGDTSCLMVVQVADHLKTDLECERYESRHDLGMIVTPVDFYFPCLIYQITTTNKL